MTGKERIHRILTRAEVDRSAYWTGNPHGDALPQYLDYFGVNTYEELCRVLGDDLFWIQAGDYHDPAGRPMWDVLGGKSRESLGQGGVFADAKTVEEIEAFPNWPDIQYVHFAGFEAQYARIKDYDMALFSGAWAPVWHLLTDFFGMENCFVKMYTHPDVVSAVMRKMTDFYLALNKRFFEKYGHLTDVFFFGNDMGSQLDCMISPDMFRTFIFPFYKQLVDQAKSYGKAVALHSCGAIDKLIPDIINLGVDVLHPIQAKAANMDAAHLQATYGGQIVFLGGVDTQDLLPFGTVQEVQNEVVRLRRLFGERYICSPSHEALLQNVAPEKLEAMAKSAVMPL